jgi:hypothetical protein
MELTSLPRPPEIWAAIPPVAQALIVAQVEGVEPTNTARARLLRPVVLWRKNCFGSDSEAGGRLVERLLTVVATCRQHGRPSPSF